MSPSREASSGVAARPLAVGHLVKIELEVDTLEQLAEALTEGVDAVLLDNMDLGMLSKASRSSTAAL